VADLKLGPLPKHRTVRIPIVVSEPLKEELDAYAAVHTRVHGEPVETPELIPHILETFLHTDRAWCRRRKQKGQGQTRQRRGEPYCDANMNGNLTAFYKQNSEK
jgi:hypothetical protein